MNFKLQNNQTRTTTEAQDFGCEAETEKLVGSGDLGLSFL
jgi:hypothetical protein